MKKRQFKITNPLFLLCLILSLLFSLVNLNSDPLPLRALETRDEAIYAYTPRNLFLYHRWQTDDLNYGLIMPVYVLFQFLGLTLFGIRIFAFRLPSVFFSIMFLALLFFFLKRNIDEISALVAVFLLSLNFFYLTFVRSAMTEVTIKEDFLSAC